MSNKTGNRQGRLSHTLGWVEKALYGSGVLLIGVFAYIKWDSHRQATEALEAFHQAAGLAQQELPQIEEFSEYRAAPEEAAETDAARKEWVEMPDQRDWSAQRVEQYAKSLEADASAPQAILFIDRLGLQVPVYNGTEESNLTRGAGRIRGTARIDEVGNLGIAAHRDSFFRPLKEIEIGDEMRLLTYEGETLYRVSSIVITDPSDVSVLKPTDEKAITLVTCYPFYYVGHAPERFIVTATVEHLLAQH